MKYNCTIPATELHLIAFLNTDLLQELHGNLDAKAAVKPLDNMQTRHGNASFAARVQFGRGLLFASFVCFLFLVGFHVLDPGRARVPQLLHGDTPLYRLDLLCGFELDESHDLLLGLFG